MSWNDFTGCMANQGHEAEEALEKVGEGAVEVIKQLAGAWRALPPDIKSYIILAAQVYGSSLAIALAALGVEAGEALEVLCMAAIAIGVGVFLDALAACSMSL
ncbi:MAG TPA: hypothetical protein VGM10_00645 [Actinocrinis sp.]|jgi:hypothetical protein